MLTERKTAIDRLRQGEVNKRSRPLTDIRAGDRVWVGVYSRPRSHGIRTVARLTPTLVIVQTTPTYEERYKRAFIPGMLHNAGGRGVISGIATPAECEAWDAAVAEQDGATRLKEIAEEQLESRRAALNTELDPCGGFATKSNRGSAHSGETWDLEFHSLTGDQVRQIAAALKSAGFKHEGEKA
jgi:hypothetical protein